MSTRPQPIKPDYDGAWIGAILPALQGTATASWLPEVAAYANRVVLLVLDGLGWEVRRDNAAHLPTINAMEGAAITCGVPSTTATGLPCITTGMSPAEHGLLGYRIGMDQGVLNVLQWRLDGGRKGPDAKTIQPVTAFGGRSLPTVVRSEFAGTGFTDAHLGGSDLRGYQTLAVLRAQVSAALDEDARVIYAYYDGVDKVAHAHGLSGPSFTAELADTDRLVSELLDLIPSDGALVITADHGHVAVDRSGIISTDAVDPLIRRMAGESRFRSLYARPNKQRELLAACEEAYADVSWVFTREELFDDGWLGPTGPAHHRHRIGDVVLAPFADVGFGDPVTPREDDMASRHGSLTSAEMLVPLIAAAGRGGG